MYIQLYLISTLFQNTFQEKENMLTYYRPTISTFSSKNTLAQHKLTYHRPTISTFSSKKHLDTA